MSPLTIPLTGSAGYQICTSTTRPSSPYEGLMIYETDTDRLRVWNGTTWIPLGVQVATAISGLVAYPGAQAQIRAGASAYHFVSLFYDSTYGKWVSPEFHIWDLSAPITGMTSTTYVDIGNSYGQIVDGASNHYSAGLALQVKSIAQMDRAGGGGSYTYFAVLPMEVDESSNTPTSLGAEIAECITDGVGRWHSSVWGQVPTASARNHLLLKPRGKILSGTAGKITMASLRGRWVSA